MKTTKFIATLLFTLTLLDATTVVEPFSCKTAQQDIVELNRVLISPDFTEAQKATFKIELDSIYDILATKDCNAKLAKTWTIKDLKDCISNGGTRVCDLKLSSIDWVSEYPKSCEEYYLKGDEVGLLNCYSTKKEDGIKWVEVKRA